MAEIRIGQTAGFTGIAASSVKEISPAMIEDYAAAKMMVEGLCRAGRPTAGSLTNALETLNGFDSGGLKVSFSEGDHSVLDFADLSIINADGRFRRLCGWRTAPETISAPMATGALASTTAAGPPTR